MKKTYKIEVDCANCAAKMEAAIRKLDGVEQASVNYFAQKLILETREDDQSEIMNAVLKACRKIEPDCEIELK